MARIAGVNVPNQKRLEIGLTYIYGIGQSTAKRICAETGLSPNEKVKDLTDEEVTKLREFIDGNLQVEGDLRRERTQAIKRLQESGAYRGIRHRRGLPVTADACARKGTEHGLQKVEVFVKGAGARRETEIRSLQAAGLELLGVKDVTPQAHNGVRPKKRRRV